MFPSAVDHVKHLRRFDEGVRTKGNRRIMMKQYPVGWEFYSHENIEFLLSRFRPQWPAITYEDLAELMIKYYETRGTGHRIIHSEQSRVQCHVRVLNELVTKELKFKLNQKIFGQRRYSRFVRKPFVPGSLKHPEATSIRDGSTLAYRGRFRDIEAKLQSAPAFNDRVGHPNRLFGQTVIMRQL